MHAVAPFMYVERDLQKDPRKCHLLGFLEVRMSSISLKHIVMVASVEFYVVSFFSMMWIVILHSNKSN
jgi:hypothetical protein